MRWQLELLSGPEAGFRAIDVTRMKRELHEFSSVTSRDADIAGKLDAAREWLEDLTGRILVDETWRLSIDHTGELEIDQSNPRLSGTSDTSPSSGQPGIYLRRSPVIAITSLVTVDADGDETLIDEGEYALRAAESKWPYVVQQSTGTWSTSNMRITFRAGFADRTGSPVDDETVIPARFKEAIILWVKGNYDDDDESMQRAVDIARRLSAQVGFA